MQPLHEAVHAADAERRVHGQHGRHMQNMGKTRIGR